MTHPAAVPAGSLVGGPAGPVLDLTLKDQLARLGDPIFRKRLVSLPLVGAYRRLETPEAARRLQQQDARLFVELDGREEPLPGLAAVRLLQALAGEKVSEKLDPTGQQVITLQHNGCRFEDDSGALSPYRYYLARRDETPVKAYFHDIQLPEGDWVPGCVETVNDDKATPAERMAALGSLLEGDGQRLEGYTPATSPIGEAHDPDLAHAVAEAIKSLGGTKTVAEFAKPLGLTSFQQRVEAAGSLKTQDPKTVRKTLQASLDAHASVREALDELRGLGRWIEPGNGYQEVLKLYREKLAGRPDALNALQTLRTNNFGLDYAVPATTRFLDDLGRLNLKERVDCYTGMGLMTGQEPLAFYSVKTTFYDVFRAMVLKGVDPKQAVSSLKRLGQALTTRQRKDQEASAAAWSASRLCRQPAGLDFFLQLIEHGFHAAAAERYSRLLIQPIAGTTLKQRLKAFEEAGLTAASKPFNAYDVLDASTGILVGLMKSGKTPQQAATAVQDLQTRLRDHGSDAPTITAALKAGATHPPLAGFVVALVEAGFHKEKLEAYAAGMLQTGCPVDAIADAFQKLGLLDADEQRRQYAVKDRLLECFAQEMGGDEGWKGAVERTLVRYAKAGTGASPVLLSQARTQAYERLIGAGYTAEQAGLAVGGFHSGADPIQAADSMLKLGSIQNVALTSTATQVCDLLQGGSTPDTVAQVGLDGLAQAGGQPSQEVRDKMGSGGAAAAVGFLSDPLFSSLREQRTAFYLDMLANRYSLGKIAEFSRLARGAHAAQIIEVFRKTGLLEGKEPLNQYTVKAAGLKAIAGYLAAGRSPEQVVELMSGCLKRSAAADQLAALTELRKLAGHPPETTRFYGALLQAKFHLPQAAQMVKLVDEHLAHLAPEQRYHAVEQAGLVDGPAPANNYEVKYEAVRLLEAELSAGSSPDKAVKRLTSILHGLIAAKADSKVALAVLSRYRENLAGRPRAARTVGAFLEQGHNADLAFEAADGVGRGTHVDDIKAAATALKGVTNAWSIVVAAGKSRPEVKFLGQALHLQEAPAQMESLLERLEQTPDTTPQQWSAAMDTLGGTEGLDVVARLVQAGTPFQQALAQVSEQREWSQKAGQSDMSMVQTLPALKSPARRERFRALVEQGVGPKLATELSEFKGEGLGLARDMGLATCDVLASPMARKQVIVAANELMKLGQTPDKIRQLLETSVQAVTARGGKAEDLAASVAQAVDLFRLGHSDAASAVSVGDESIMIGDFELARES